ncbi:hypothetical protein MTO96_013250 [Rhipicephalus appendiculatus]
MKKRIFCSYVDLHHIIIKTPHLLSATPLSSSFLSSTPKKFPYASLVMRDLAFWGRPLTDAWFPPLRWAHRRRAHRLSVGSAERTGYAQPDLQRQAGTVRRTFGLASARIVEPISAVPSSVLRTVFHRGSSLGIRMKYPEYPSHRISCFR